MDHRKTNNATLPSRLTGIRQFRQQVTESGFGRKPKSRLIKAERRHETRSERVAERKQRSRRTEPAFVGVWCWCNFPQASTSPHISYQLGAMWECVRVRVLGTILIGLQTVAVVPPHATTAHPCWRSTAHFRLMNLGRRLAGMCPNFNLNNKMNGFSCQQANKICKTKLVK